MKLEPPLGIHNDFAARGDPTGQARDKPADSVDFGLFADRQGPARFGQHVREFRASVDAERIRTILHDRVRLDIVVLVLDIAHDDLDDILDRDETVGPAIFVDHERHMRARRLHSHEKIKRRHGRRDEQHRADDAGGLQRDGEIDDVGRDAAAPCRLGHHVGLGRGIRPAAPVLGLGAACDMIDEIADMHHAAGIVERVAVHRQARVAGGTKQREHVRQRGCDGDRDDVGARDHDVADAMLVQRQHVAQDGALLGREVAVRPAIVLQRLLKFLADRWRRQAERVTQALDEAGARRAAVVLPPPGFGRLAHRGGASARGSVAA